MPREFVLATTARKQSTLRGSSTQAGGSFSDKTGCPHVYDGMPPCLCHCVFDSLHWASPNDLPSWLGLEYCGFLCKRIDASTLLCGGLLNDNKFRESGYKEGPRFLEFFVA